MNNAVYIAENYEARKKGRKKQKLPTTANAVGSRRINKSDTFNYFNYFIFSILDK